MKKKEQKKSTEVPANENQPQMLYDLSKGVTILTVSTRRRENTCNYINVFLDKEYAIKEMKKDVQHFKEAHFDGTYEVLREEDCLVEIATLNSIIIKWEILSQCRVEIEGVYKHDYPNRYNRFPLQNNQ